MSEPIRITAPLDKETIARLHTGDSVLISGSILTGRDAAHKRMFELLKEGKPLPVDIKDQVIYYVGPTPARPGTPIGSAGPTTSYRMDAYAPLLIEHGLRGMIGKGQRNQEVRDAIQKFGAIYFAAVGGAGALLAKRIKAAQVIAYEELGAEAIRRLTVEDFPAIVINDIYGGDLYDSGVPPYRRD
jgi:fumarate hydratase subunit beta